MKQDTKQEAAFTDYFSYKKVKNTQQMFRGNLIKGKNVSVRREHTIDVSAEQSDQASVIFHRNGELVEGIEFICKCGCSAFVKIDSDE